MIDYHLLKGNIIEMQEYANNNKVLSEISLMTICTQILDVVKKKIHQLKRLSWCIVNDGDKAWKVWKNALWIDKQLT